MEIIRKWQLKILKMMGKPIESILIKTKNIIFLKKLYIFANNLQWYYIIYCF